MENVVSIRELDGNIIKLEVHRELPSTVELAREYAKAGYPDRYAVFAERQNKSTLTGSKASNEEIENGIFMSIILRPSIFPSQASLMGALSATAMIKALEEHTVKRLGLGWVSDLYCEGVKIGSTAIEGKLDNFTTYEYIIVTFAVKLNEKNFPPRLTDMIKKVFESENTSVSMIIARNILSKFFQFYASIKSPGIFMDIYKKKFVLRGRRVRYEHGQKKQSCKVLGVDPVTGALVLELPGGKVHEVTTPMYITTPKKIRLKKIKEAQS